MNPVATFFMVGGFLFLLVALFLRELNDEAAQIVALTFAMIGFFWIVPQVILWYARRNR